MAEKLLKRAEAMPKLEPPDDRSITTLYIGNLAEKVTENELRYVHFLISNYKFLTVPVLLTEITSTNTARSATLRWCLGSSVPSSSTPQGVLLK